MSDIKSMDLTDTLSSHTLLNINGVLMGDDLKDTLKINSSRVNKNTGDYYTPTLIIFSYVRDVNDRELMGCNDKIRYLNVARGLLSELKSCGFEIGKKWRGLNLLPYSKGNKKLSKDTIIINVSPSSLCISSNNGRCELCEICYALSSERRYLNTLIYRLTQLIKFEEMSVDEIVSQFINMRVIRWMRWDEAGDVFNMDDVKKMYDVSKMLFEIKGVRSYLYTHREDLWDEMMEYQSPFFKINRSGVDFISLPSISSNHNTLMCDGKCNYCIYCKIVLNTPISILYHGEIDGEDLRDVSTRRRDFILKWECYKMYEAGCDVSDIISHINSTLSIYEEEI